MRVRHLMMASLVAGASFVGGQALANNTVTGAVVGAGVGGLTNGMGGAVRGGLIGGGVDRKSVV